MLAVADSLMIMNLYRNDIEKLPEIGAPTQEKTYFLLWFDHRRYPYPQEQPLFRVEYTNLGEADHINNDLFQSWCQIFDAAPYVLTGFKLVAADEEFKTDYTVWQNPPYNLPKLTKRFFEIMDDERWYVVECSSR